MLTEVLGDVAEVVGLVEVPEAAQVGVQLLAVPQLDAVGEHQQAPRPQHTRHLSRGRAPHLRGQLVKEVHARHLGSADQSRVGSCDQIFCRARKRCQELELHISLARIFGR